MPTYKVDLDLFRQIIVKCVLDLFYAIKRMNISNFYLKMSSVHHRKNSDNFFIVHNRLLSFIIADIS